MTVIAWDGTRLAADKRATFGGLFRTTTKIRRSQRTGALLGATGTATGDAELVAWYEAGAVPADFPAAQRDDDECSTLVVIEPGPRVLFYRCTPHPAVFEDAHFAAGSGRDFALAAMRLGKTAAEAVALACEFDCNCGNGVDVLTLEGAT